MRRDTFGILSTMNSDFPELVSLPGGPAHVRWRRSKRARRVSLRIDLKGGHVVVTLPQRACRSTGMALLLSHADWVRDRLQSLPQPVRLTDGAAVPLHGEMHVLRHMPAARAGVQVRQGEIHVSGEADFLQRRVLDFLRLEARRSLVPLAMSKAESIGRRPSRITLKDTSSRWGSCTASGNLAFSWRLVMAPRFVQDFVVAHEVAHLHHMNHSQQFWSLVSDLTPQMDEAMLWLRRDGLQLLRVG